MVTGNSKISFKFPRFIFLVFLFPLCVPFTFTSFNHPAFLEGFTSTKNYFCKFVEKRREIANLAITHDIQTDVYSV